MQQHEQPRDTSNVSAQFGAYYESKQRIEVQSPWGELLRGYVGKTTGWKPCYLLLLRRNSHGSVYLLNDLWTIKKSLPVFK